MTKELPLERKKSAKKPKKEIPSRKYPSHEMEESVAAIGAMSDSDEWLVVCYKFDPETKRQMLSTYCSHPLLPAQLAKECLNYFQDGCFGDVADEEEDL